MGNIQKQAIQNTIISYTGVIIGFVNTLVLQPKMLLAEELGLTRILYSVSILIATLFPLGLNSFTIKFFPKFRNPENGHNGYFGLLLLFALAGFIIVVIGILMCKNFILAKYQNSPLFVEYFLYVFPMSFCLGLITVLYGYSMAIFKTSFPAFLNEVFIRLATMVIVSLYFLKLINLSVFVFLSTISLTIQAVLLFAYITRVDNISFKINWELARTFAVKKTLHYVFLLSVAALASMAIRNNVDNILIGSYLDLDHVAVYSVAFLIASLIEVPAGALSKIADPKISDAITRNDTRLIKEVYYKSTRLLMIVGGILFVGIVINIDELLLLLPPKYAAGANCVTIISFSAFLNMATGINNPMIFYSDKYKQGSWLLIGTIAISVLLNMLLIPLWGIEGAAVAAAVSFILFNIFKAIIIYKAFHMQPFGSYVLIVIALIAACIGINYMLPQLDSPILDIGYRSAVVTIIYASGIYLTGTATEAVEFIKKIRKMVPGS